MGCGLESVSQRIGSTGGLCENSNKPSVFIKTEWLYTFQVKARIAKCYYAYMKCKYLYLHHVRLILRYNIF
jgi:hypothetical protein